ncbi:MAG: hypothetical protein KA020_12320 [Planctomycetes bacterium]|nr:hypothetical protein [Planctomycetota bacterium]MCC7064946.1 hypothetical protein [Planctomycetota bacterium]
MHYLVGSEVAVNIAQRVLPVVRLLLVLALAAVVSAQKKKEAPQFRYQMPEKIEREVAKDAAGYLQWGEYKPIKCVTCEGTGKTLCATCERAPEDTPKCIECQRNKELEAVCRVCAGVGTFPDPLAKVSCPECHGAGFFLCTLCGGDGRIKTQGGGDRYGTCPMCRGDGGYKCGVCAGERLVETASLKPSLKDASSALLTKAIATTDQMLTALTAFEPAAKNSRKETKELAKILEKGKDVFPPMKRAPKALEEVMNKVYGGSAYVDYKEREANAMAVFKANCEYYLKHQKRMMELALKRAEANEKLAAENKGK